MEIGKERSDLGSYLSMGAEIIENEWHKGEIFVKRRGMLHPKYSFLHNDKEFATLHWHRSRIGTYIATGMIDFQLDLEVTSMGRIITAKDKMTNLSRLTNKSLNQAKPRLSIELSNGDNFFLNQTSKKTGKYQHTLTVIKAHYIHSLAEFKFNQQTGRSHTITAINVEPIMRWEAEHFHHLMALIMSRIAFIQEHGKTY